MSIRLKLTIVYTSLLVGSIILIGISIFQLQKNQTIFLLKGEITQTSIGIMNALTNPRQNMIPPERIESSQSGSSDSTPDDGSPSFPDYSGIQASPANTEGYPPSNPEDQSQFQPGPFKDRSPEIFDQMLQSETDKVFDIVNILDLEENFIYNPIQRNIQSIPITEESRAVLNQTIKPVWQPTYVDNTPYLVEISPILENDEIVGYLQVARTLTTVNDYLKSLVTIMLGFGIGAVIISIFMGWFISGLTLKTIDRITQTAGEIGEEQDFSKRVNYSGPKDEIGRLVETFNSMLEKLQAAYERMKYSLNQQRNFVADVSHELRTPLTTIRGNLALLDSPKSINETDRKEIISDMIEETDRLTKLVNELLILARADLEEKLYLKPLLVRPVVEEAVRQLSVLDPAREIRISIPDNLQILSERTKLKQLFIIFLDNALKHSKGNIEIEAETDVSNVVISIIDHGEGIPKEEINRIFERFYQSGQSRYRTGNGLGLPIAVSLAKSLNGTIDVMSIPDVKTAFRIHLKLA
ncbi:MAG: sensor histidine kinase [Flexilinea sp.]